MKGQTPQWTIPNEELLDGSILALKNTDRLLADSKILFDNKRFSASLALSILAFEEFGKCLLLYEATAKNIRITSEIWRHSFMSHKVKLNAIFRILAMEPAKPEYRKDAEKQAKLLEQLLNTWESRKIEAIYLDWDSRDNKWYCYDDKAEDVKEKDAREALTVIRRLFESFKGKMGDIGYSTKKEKIQALRDGKAYCFCEDCGLVMLNEKEFVSHFKRTNHMILWFKK